MRNSSRNLPWSCDTLVVLPQLSGNGATMLGKNSDRPAFDCQCVVRFPNEKHQENETIKLSYIEIPQAKVTYATVGSSPYWCWGYEEGFNEYGVAIGNEAIFTRDVALKVKEEKNNVNHENGILGMELLRLGLERGKTAREALDAMTALVSTYGQWGSGVPCDGHAGGSYNNSFMIADKNEAWVLETIGKEWAAKRVDGCEAISNEPSIRTRWDLSSNRLVETAVTSGWWPKGKAAQFDLAYAYTDPEKPLQLSHIRAQRNRQLLRQAIDEKGKVDFEWIKRILRDHYEDTFLEGPYFNAALPDFLTVCMHSSPAGFTWGNTASSAVFILPKEKDRLPVMWWSPVTPCTGLYLPVFAGCSGLPEILSMAGTAGRHQTPPPSAQEDTYSASSYWWIFRDLLDMVKGDEQGSKYNQRHREVRNAFNKLEKEWISQADEVEGKAVALMKKGENEKAANLLSQFTADCVRQAVAEVSKVKRVIEQI